MIKKCERKSRVFGVPESKIAQFRTFLLLSKKYMNLWSMIKCHATEIEENVGDKEYHQKMITYYHEVLKKVIEDRAYVLCDILDNTYSFERLNTDDLNYQYSYLGREIIFYE